MFRRNQPQPQPPQHRKISYVTYDLTTASRLRLLSYVVNRAEMMSDIADSLFGAQNYGGSGDYQNGMDLEGRAGYGADPLYDDPFGPDPFAEADREFAAMEREMDAMISYDPLADDPLADEARAIDAEADFLERAPLRRPAYHNGLVYIVTNRGYE